MSEITEALTKNDCNIEDLLVDSGVSATITGAVTIGLLGKNFAAWQIAGTFTSNLITGFGRNCVVPFLPTHFSKYQSYIFSGVAEIVETLFTGALSSKYSLVRGLVQESWFNHNPFKDTSYEAPSNLVFNIALNMGTAKLLKSKTKFVNSDNIHFFQENKDKINNHLGELLPAINKIDGLPDLPVADKKIVQKAKESNIKARELYSIVTTSARAELEKAKAIISDLSLENIQDKAVKLKEAIEILTANIFKNLEVQSGDINNILLSPKKIVKNKAEDVQNILKLKDSLFEILASIEIFKIEVPEFSCPIEKNPFKLAVTKTIANEVYENQLTLLNKAYNSVIYNNYRYSSFNEFSKVLLEQIRNYNHPNKLFSKILELGLLDDMIIQRIANEDKNVAVETFADRYFEEILVNELEEIGKSFKELKYHAEANIIYQRILDKIDSSMVDNIAILKLNMADNYIKLKKYNKAEKILLEAKNSNIKSENVVLIENRLAYVYFYQKRFKESTKLVTKLLKTNPNDKFLIDLSEKIENNILSKMLTAFNKDKMLDLNERDFESDVEGLKDDIQYLSGMNNDLLGTEAYKAWD